MSLKSFHMLFIIISTMFSIVFSFLCYSKWTISHDSMYLGLFLLGIMLCGILLFYSKWFLREIEKINSN